MSLNLSRKLLHRRTRSRYLTALLILLLGSLLFLAACSESKFRPSPERVEPNGGCANQSIPVEITGDNFVATIFEDIGKKKGPEVNKLFSVVLRHTETGEERSLVNIIFYNSTRFIAEVPAGLAIGWHDLIVTNPDGESGTLPEAFYVFSISDIEPAVGCPGEQVTITGSGFGTDTGVITFSSYGPDTGTFTVTGTTVISWSDTAVVVSAPIGDYFEVTVTHAADESWFCSLSGSYYYYDVIPTGLMAVPAGGTYCSTTVVNLSVTGGIIYYTLDGSGPTTGSLIYTDTAPIVVTVDTTVSFMAREDICGNQTAIVTEFYDIDWEAPTTLVASPAGGSYCPTMVTLSASDGTIYYTLDGSGPTSASLVYAGPIGIGMDTTLNFMAVDACGYQSATTTEFYNIDLEAPTTLVASPAGGSYCPTMVTLSASDGTIYYTLDGSGPTSASLVYAGPIGVGMDTTLNFMAVDICGNQSATMNVVYNIDAGAVVTITSPTDGVTINPGNVPVTGTADTDIATVTVTSNQGHNSGPTTVIGGNWSATLLAVSVPSIAITARGTDNCGNIGSDSITVPVVIPGCSIVSVGPVTGCPADLVTITGSGFGPNTSTVSFDATPAFIVSWGATTIVVSAPGGIYNNVTVAPIAANPCSLPGIYSYDNQTPTVDVNPLVCQTTGNVTVSAVCADVGSGVATCEVSIDGINWFASPYVCNGLTTGSYTAIGRVSDNCGNTASDLVGEPFEVDTVAPVVSINSPADGECIATSKVSVDASSDGGELVTCTLDGLSSITVPGSWVLVADGPHTIICSSMDTCGNNSIPVSVTIIVDMVAVVTITYPTDGETVVAGTVTVSGTADTDIATVTVTSDQGHNESSPVDFGGNWSVTLNGVTVPYIVITARGVDDCGNIGSDSSINDVILPAQLTIIKIVENLTRLTGPSSTVDAVTGDQINYIVTIKNNGEEDATLSDGDFSDLIPGGLTCDGPVTVIGAVSGELICNPLNGEVTITDPIVISGPSTVVFTYRATVD